MTYEIFMRQLIWISLVTLMIQGCSSSSQSHTTRRAPLSPYQRQLQEADAHFTKQIEAGSSSNVSAAYLERGKTRLALAEYEEAIADLKTAIQLAPENAEAYAALSVCYHMQGKPYDELVARGWSEYYQGQIQAMQASFNAAINVESRRPEGWIGRSKSYVALGKIDAGLKDLDMAVRLEPQSLDARFQRGQLLSSQGKPDLALIDVDQVLAKKADHYEARFLRGAIYEDQERHDHALIELNLVLREMPKHVKAYMKRSQVYLMKGQSDLAIEDAKRIALLDPGNPYASIIRGIVSFKQGQLDEAIQHFDSGVRTSVEYSANALMVYDQIIRDHPELGAAHHARAIAYYQSGRFLDAIREFDVVLTASANDSQAQYDRGMTYARLGKYGDAIKDFEDALVNGHTFKTTVLSGEQLNRISPTSGSWESPAARIGGMRNPDIHWNLAWAYYSTGQYGRSAEVLGKVTQANRNDHEAFFFYALLNAKLGYLKAAINFATYASQLAPTIEIYKTTATELVKLEKARDRAQFESLILGGLAVIVGSAVVDEERCDKTPGCRQKRLQETLDDMERQRRKAIDDFMTRQLLGR